MLAPVVMSRNDACLVSAGALLSAIGLALLALDAFSGAQPWAFFARQAAGFGAGLASCAFHVHRRARPRDPVVLHVLIAPLVVLVPHLDPPALLADRMLLAALLTWAAVGSVASLLLWRLSRCGPDQWLRLRDVACVLPPVVLCAIAAIGVHGGLAPPLTIAIAAAVMARSVGVRRWQALLPVVTLLLLIFIPAMSRDYRRARLAAILVEAIQRESPTHSHSMSLAEMMVRRRDVAVRLGGGVPIWVTLPPREAGQLALARVVAEAGYSGASVVVLLFGVIGWVGFWSVSGERLCVTRLILAGTTSALVVPVAWHVLGGLVFFSNRSGPLPFVGYGPPEQVLSWMALGVIAVAREARGAEANACARG